jgi:hypothetical protein
LSIDGATGSEYIKDWIVKWALGTAALDFHPSYCSAI